jgi:predicted nuclease of predicted toxin-antitoxin system
MKLLFDENLSFRLVRSLAETYPSSAHVREPGLLGASDEAIWLHAAEHDFLLTSKDADFSQRSVAYGSPPKVIWL